MYMHLRHSMILRAEYRIGYTMYEYKHVYYPFIILFLRLEA